jgi:hypothetical protein
MPRFVSKIKSSMFSTPPRQEGPEAARVRAMNLALEKKRLARLGLAPTPAPDAPPPRAPPSGRQASQEPPVVQGPRYPEYPAVKASTFKPLTMKQLLEKR